MMRREKMHQCVEGGQSAAHNAAVQIVQNCIANPSICIVVFIEYGQNVTLTNVTALIISFYGDRTEPVSGSLLTLQLKQRKVRQHWEQLN
jgi:hypothetical protein